MAIHRTDTALELTGHPVRFDILAASSFEGDTRQAIIGLKYRNERRNAQLLAALLVPLVPAGTEVLTWAPTSDRRRMTRGVDHAELLVRHLAAFTGVPVRALLRRVGHSVQTGSTRVQRAHSVRFVARRASRPVRVVVVDDVVTTGATMRAAVRALHEAGHAGVTCLCVASVE